EPALTIARAVDRVADELGASSAQVATAWVRAQGYRFIPIVGARTVEQIEDTLGTASIELSAAQLGALDEVSRVSLGFPHEFLRSDGVLDMVRSEQRGRIDGRRARR
ncbi:MAG: aldo/keto reductase, partial [Deltaproteobacteria bacterium]|nr:aldo/keto reductase [Nannocystaceae bacterium]